MRRLVLLAVIAVLGADIGVAVARGDHSGGASCTTMSRSCVIAVARTYVDAQAGGPGTAEEIRLAPKAIRWENGLVTGRSAADIRAQSGGGASPVISPRDTHDHDRVFVDASTPDVAHVFVLWLEDVRAPGSTTYTSTAHIFERIQVQRHGCSPKPAPCISQIEAVFCIGNRGKESPEPAATAANEPTALPQFLCYRGS